MKKTKLKNTSLKYLWVLQLVEFLASSFSLIEAYFKTGYVFIKPRSYAAFSFFLLEKSLLLDGVPLLTIIAFFVIPIIKVFLVICVKKQYVWANITTIVMCCVEIIFSTISFFPLDDRILNTLPWFPLVNIVVIGVYIMIIRYSVLAIKLLNCKPAKIVDGEE